MEYRFLVIEHSFEIYGGLIAITFAVLGIWLTLKLTRPRQSALATQLPAPSLANALITFIEPFPIGLAILPISAGVLRKTSPSAAASAPLPVSRGNF